MIQIKVKINGEEKVLSLPKKEITDKVTYATVTFAEEFGTYLGKDDKETNPKSGKTMVVASHLSTSQLRKFFGEVKRQDMNDYNETEFVLLKPKLAYTVGRADKNSKIKYFYNVISNAIDVVLNSANPENSFNNFIKIFEAIVAYHKAAEEQK